VVDAVSDAAGQRAGIYRACEAVRAEREAKARPVLLKPLNSYLELLRFRIRATGWQFKLAAVALCGLIAFMVCFKQAFGGTFATEKHSVSCSPRGPEYISGGNFAPDVDLCTPSTEGRIFLRSHFVKEVDKEYRRAAGANYPASLVRSIRKVRNVTLADANYSYPLHNAVCWRFPEIFYLYFSPKNSALFPIALRHFHMDIAVRANGRGRGRGQIDHPGGTTGGDGTGHANALPLKGGSAMKPIVEYVALGSASIRLVSRLASRLASRFATKVDIEANIHQFDGASTRLTVRVAAGLLGAVHDELINGGKLYAIESTTRPLFGARFQHRGKWYLVVKKEDWEHLSSNALELASAVSPEERASIASRLVGEAISGKAKDA
jgi:hypothetical protein